MHKIFKTQLQIVIFLYLFDKHTASRQSEEEIKSQLVARGTELRPDALPVRSLQGKEGDGQVVSHL